MVNRFVRKCVYCLLVCAPDWRASVLVGGLFDSL